MFDATDLEIARREHDYEMGGESQSDRAWSRWYDRAAATITANGWNTDRSRGLDGSEIPGDDDGYSIDGAYDAFEARWSVERYIAHVATRRAELGL